MKQRQEYTVIYDDDAITAVNKAAGIAVSADRWDNEKERLDRLLEAALGDAEESPRRLFIVHRIDRDTSGLVIFAKDSETHRTISRAFENRQVEKRYIAVVHGRPAWTETVCDLPLIPDGDKQHRTIIDKYKGKKSLTHFRVLCCVGNYSVLEARPETGRTHQIRVHLASLGHSVVCDPLYGRGSPRPVLLSSFKRNWQGDPLEEKPLLSRLGLHAADLFLPDYPGAASAPESGLRLEAPLPRDMAALIKQMEKAGGAKTVANDVSI